MASNQISAVVQSATREIIANTEAMIQAAAGKAPGDDAVSILYNGEKTVLTKEDYDALKARNGAVKAEMKRKIKEITTSLKEQAKPKPTSPTTEE